MKLSHLAIVLTSLLVSFGEVKESDQLEFLEVFSGQHILHDGALAHGLRSRCIDVEYSIKYDVTEAFGFLLLLYQARRLVRHGLAWYAIPCNTWVFMSRGSTKRSHFRVRGDTKFRSVRQGNRLARRISYMLHYNFRKGVSYVLENPLSSLLWKYKCIQKRLRQHNAHRVVVHLGAYGSYTSKPVVLYGTAPFLAELERKVTAFRKLQLARIRSFLKIKTVRSYTCPKTGKTRVAGGPSLKATQVYPGAFGLAVGRLLQRELSRSHNETGLEPDSGLPFCDTDEDSSDSGLEGLAVPSKTEMELDH